MNGSPSGLQVAGVGVAFGATQALRDVDLQAPPGRIVAVLGPSGCGKSTLLRVVAGLQPPDAGRIRFGEQDVTAVPTHRRGFALMFQDGQLFAHLDVAANVAYPLRRQRISRRDTQQQVQELLALVGLEGFADRSPLTLSGGQQQRVALARALAARPRLLLLDEPLSALDRDLRERLAVDVRQILVETGTTALLVTHDHSEAFTMADDAVLLRAGRVIQQGTVQQVWSEPVDVEAARFLGFRTILTGSGALAVRRALGVTGDGPVALRRGALRVVPEGDPAACWSGRVTDTSYGAEDLTLILDVDHLGEMVATAVAPRAPGEQVWLAVVPAQVATGITGRS